MARSFLIFCSFVTLSTGCIPSSDEYTYQAPTTSTNTTETTDLGAGDMSPLLQDMLDLSAPPDDASMEMDLATNLPDQYMPLVDRCQGKSCACSKEAVCDFGAVEVETRVVCSGGQGCKVSSCDGACSMACQGSGGACEFLGLGTGSTVSCEGTGLDCSKVICAGKSCTVECSGTGTVCEPDCNEPGARCELRCSQGASCSFKSCRRAVESCGIVQGKELFVCGARCP